MSVPISAITMGPAIWPILAAPYACVRCSSKRSFVSARCTVIDTAKPPRASAPLPTAASEAPIEVPARMSSAEVRNDHC